MPAQNNCPDDIFILQNKFCLSEISKNLKGKLALRDKRIQKCETPKCETLITVHELIVKLTAQRPCDSALAKPLSGTLTVTRLATGFNKNGKGRGLHAGSFVWTGSAGIRIEGKISGITNAGTHRGPVFKECQVCHETGVMDGQLCGKIVQAEDAKLLNCQVTAAYLIKFDPSESGGEGVALGTLEGFLICRCTG